MTLLQSKDGIHYFTFEHNRDYQQVQFKFLDAVESMDPNNIVVKKKNSSFSAVQVGVSEFICSNNSNQTSSILMLSGKIISNPELQRGLCNIGWQGYSYNIASTI